MKKANLLIIIILLLFSIKSFSQTNNEYQEDTKLHSPIITDSILEAKIRCDNFFKQLMSSDYSKAFSYILKNSPIAKDDEKVKSVINQFKKSVDAYGALGGYELVKIDKVTNSYIKFNYIGLNADVPVRWIFTFYKSPQKGWIITNIKFDDLAELYFRD